MAFDEPESPLTPEQGMPFRPYELPPLIPPASREPFWLALLGLACFLGLLGMIWWSHRAAGDAQSASFQTSVKARINTYLVEMLLYHREHGKPPAWASETMNIEELATRTADDWRSVSEEGTDAKLQGLTALNAAALYGVTGNTVSAQAMLDRAARRDPERKAQYRALLPLYAGAPRPIRLTEPIRDMLMKISAGPLVQAHNARLLGKSGDVSAALQSGARAGQRLILVSGVILLLFIFTVLGMLVALIIRGPRLAKAVGEMERTPGAEVPWGIGTGLIVISLSYFTIFFVKSVLAILVTKGNADTELMLDLLSNLLGPLCIISLFLAALGRKPWEWGLLGWTPSRRGIRYGVLALALALPIVMGASYLSGRVFGDQQGANPLISDMLTARNPLLLLMIVVTAAVVAPLMEETLFRGILFRAANVRLPFWAAAFGSGLIFASGHYLLVALLPITLLGMLFAFLTRRSQSLLASAGAHTAYNGMITAVVLLTSWALNGPGS